MYACACKSGVLFDHACGAQASQACARCARPVCQTHARMTQNGLTCVDCLRQVMKDRQARGYFAHLRDDPYFFWYFDGADWFDAYDEQDYALFDAGPGGGGESDDGALAVGEAWEGS
jgi:hypothetical protein